MLARLLAVFAISFLLVSPALQAEDFSNRLTLVAEGYGKKHIAIRDESGQILWKQKVRGGQHDVHMLDNGNILFQDDWKNIGEMTLDKKIVWHYNAGTMNGNNGRVEVHAFMRLDNGLTMIAESGPKRIIEVDKDGVLKIDEMNRSLATMQSTALEKLLRMSSMGLYTFNASSASSLPSLPGSPSAMLDSDGDS